MNIYLLIYYFDSISQSHILMGPIMHLYIPWYVLPILLIIGSFYFFIIREPDGMYDFTGPLIGMGFLIASISFVAGHFI